MRPDALKLDPALKTGDLMVDRVHSICRIAEPLLQVDYAGGERAYICTLPEQLGGWLFITRDAASTLLFPGGHPKSGQPRYRWERQTDGTELGYLIDD